MLSSASRPPQPTLGATDSSPSWHYIPHSDQQSSHQQVLRLVQRYANGGPVLDVGAAQGMLGQALGEDLPIDAVEPHPRWAEHARAFYRNVFATAIEQAPLPKAAYTTVVCADVLEHTADPLVVLRQLRRAAQPGAIFIVSLPNVAHLSARPLLMSGRWPQMERGIFDRTHLHFYTRRTAEHLLHQAGLRVLRARPTPVPLYMAWPAGWNPLGLRVAMAVQRSALLLNPALFGFQWVFVAQCVARSTQHDAS
ncbi:MAG: class I SAM-dependent methyltransferase [Roseiflexaceae bacterium]|nr:class I SAM-dependent methyltransferase [Roseiflexaceae bacterium]